MKKCDQSCGKSVEVEQEVELGRFRRFLVHSVEVDLTSEDFLANHGV